MEISDNSIRVFVIDSLPLEIDTRKLFGLVGPLRIWYYYHIFNYDEKINDYISYDDLRKYLKDNKYPLDVNKQLLSMYTTEFNRLYSTYRPSDFNKPMRVEIYKKFVLDIMITYFIGYLNNTVLKKLITNHEIIDKYNLAGQDELTSEFLDKNNLEEVGSIGRVLYMYVDPQNVFKKYNFVNDNTISSILGHYSIRFLDEKFIDLGKFYKPKGLNIE